MSSLPQRIPPQTVSLGSVDGSGQLIIDINWYLFFYNIANQVLTGTGLPVSQSDLLDMVDLDASQSDLPQAFRHISNLEQLQFDEVTQADLRKFATRDLQLLIHDQDAPQTRDIVNALIAGWDVILPDPVPAAQPIQAVTVGASPFTYTALRDGVLCLSASASTSIFIARNGTSVDSGATIGPIPLRRGDQAVITYAVKPTANFLPN